MDTQEQGVAGRRKMRYHQIGYWKSTDRAARADAELCRTSKFLSVGKYSMPIYEYEHMASDCEWGRVFETRQSINDPPLHSCPHCGEPVRKLISLNFVSTPKFNGELRDLGFTKLVKRDDGVYENVTRRDGDHRYMLRNRPETIPNLNKTLTD
jgi:putative FmdB family regulatory protein